MTYQPTSLHIEGQKRQDIPAFIARVRQADGSEINLIIEVTGEKRKDKEAKIATTYNLWLPAVNRTGEYGNWDIAEVTDPWRFSDEEVTKFSTVEKGSD